MVQIDGAVIVVPEELKDTILREGYRYTLRHRVPCSRDRAAAVRAFQRNHPHKAHSVIKVTSLPPGVDTEEYKDGFKINIPHLPAAHLRSGSVAGFAPQSRSLPSELPLCEIYYTQDSIADHFQDGRMLRQTKHELQSGRTTVHDIPIITVVWYNSKWFTVDNRRVCVYKSVHPASFKIPVRIGVVDERFYNKLKQPHGGTSVSVRGRGFH
mmetsp:Transcript_66334/g.154101  ORF Transcript_66334/g.154101 Transcript_66334/m.154101 type:complete len:211 (-) Transcript_66334:13-645(-)